MHHLRQQSGCSVQFAPGTEASDEDVVGVDVPGHAGACHVGDEVVNCSERGLARPEHGVEEGVEGEGGRRKAGIFGEGENGEGLRDEG